LLQTDMTTQRRMLQRAAAWSASTGASAYVDGAGVHVTPGSSEVPLTVPAGTRTTGAALESYAGELSGWVATATDAVTPLAAAGYRLPVPAQVAPDAPGTPTAVAGYGEVTVTWTAPLSSGSAPLTGYLVRAYTADASSAAVETPVSASTTRLSSRV
jgi:hypothetical protein